MSRIFISDSSTGLGMMAAKVLHSQGHEVSFTHVTTLERARRKENYPEPKQS